MTTLPPDNASTSLAPISRNGRALSTVPSGSTLIMLAEPRSAAAEAYRALAANLQFSSRDFDVQTIGITSAAPGEGKSTTTANLAIALAEGGRQVIVIDADLRRPVLHTLFGLDNTRVCRTCCWASETRLPLQDTVAPGGAAADEWAAAGQSARGARLARVGPRARAGARAGRFRRRRLGASGRAGRRRGAGAAPRRRPAGDQRGKTKRDLARRAREQLERVNANVLGVVLVDVKGDDKLYRY